MIPNITRGSDPAGLQKYLLEHRDHEVLDLAGVSSVHAAAEEMESIAAQNRRARASVFHVSLSAAIEDGLISAERWIAAALEVECELGLTGHQRVIVRHCDKAYDHVHVFWCTISPDTFRTPPKQPFLAAGKIREEQGRYRLNADEVSRVPEEAVIYRAFDSFALYRLQDVCRRLEREWNLRRVRDHHEIAAARAAGELRPSSRTAELREERTGTASLLTRGDDLRKALDAPNWSAALRLLKPLAVGLEPVFRKSREGRGKLVGLVLYDVHDQGCRIKASALDTPQKRYGLLQIEKRHAAGAPRLEEWWSASAVVTASPLAPVRRSDAPYDRCREAFDLARVAARAENEERRRRRRELQGRQAAEVRRLRAELMKRRRVEASRLPQSERRAFYRWVSTELRPSMFQKLAGEHRIELAEFRQVPLPRWKSFVEQRARNGDPDARLLSKKWCRKEGAEARQLEPPAKQMQAHLLSTSCGLSADAMPGPRKRTSRENATTVAAPYPPISKPSAAELTELQLRAFLEEMRRQRGR